MAMDAATRRWWARYKREQTPVGNVVGFMVYCCPAAVGTNAPCPEHVRDLYADGWPNIMLWLRHSLAAHGLDLLFGHLSMAYAEIDEAAGRVG